MKLDIKLWVATHDTKWDVDAYVFTSEEEMEKARKENVNPYTADEYWDFSVQTITINTEDYT